MKSIISQIDNHIQKALSYKGYDAHALRSNTNYISSSYVIEVQKTLSEAGFNDAASIVGNISFRPAFETKADSPSEWERYAASARDGLQSIISILEQVKGQINTTQNKRNFKITIIIGALTLIATLVSIVISICKN